MASDKLFISADQLLDDAFRLAGRIIDSAFHPDILIAFWRGGTPVAIAIQELFTYVGLEHQHFVVKSRHYAGIDHRHDDVVIEGLEEILGKLSTKGKVLLVDDVFDTGRTLDKAASLIEPHLDGKEQLCIATPYYKPGKNFTGRVPDYYLHETDSWIVFPHEIVGLETGEIMRGKSHLGALTEFIDKHRR